MGQNAEQATVTCLTCQHRYTSTAFGSRISGCLVYNECGPVSGQIVRDHLESERSRLGRLPTFDEVENCPAHEAGPPLYTERT